MGGQKNRENEPRNASVSRKTKRKKTNKTQKELCGSMYLMEMGRKYQTHLKLINKTLLPTDYFNQTQILKQIQRMRYRQQILLSVQRELERRRTQPTSKTLILQTMMERLKWSKKLMLIFPSTTRTQVLAGLMSEL
jgi:uncharacterized protein YjgD (DUF1641 family)